MTLKLKLMVTGLVLTAALAHGSIRITEVGLKGYYSPTAPTPVTVQVDVPQGVDDIQVDFAISVDEHDNLPPIRVDHFSKRVQVAPAQRIDFVVPITLPQWNASKLKVDVSEPNGRRLGSSVVDLNSLTRVNPNNLLVLYCSDRNVCDEAQGKISFSGSNEDVEKKNRELKFLTLQMPRQQWMDYALASRVVVAGSISSWTAEQQTALEQYARQGGSIVLLEKESADPAFLKAYRTCKCEGRVTVGHGSVNLVNSLRSEELGRLFAGKNLNAEDIIPNPPVGSADWVRRLAATSFEFPRFRWFLIWLGAYILIIGLGNFAFLRRIRRLEWGWLTTTSIAVLFAAGLYFASSANRPKQVIVDDLTVYWMDDKSGAAVEDVGLRVSSPERQHLEVTVGDDAVLESRSPAGTRTTNVDIATEITRERRLEPGWQVQLGPPLGIELSLLRWSFADLDFQSFRTFPGTVTMGSNMHLKNGTGRQFREAIYLDYKKNRKYLIPSFGPGEETDLSAVSWQPIWVTVTRNVGETIFAVNEAPTFSGRRKAALSLNDLPWFSSSGLGNVFVGLSDGPVPEAGVGRMKFARNNVSLTVIDLDLP